jgi:hypothetical protein
MFMNMGSLRTMRAAATGRRGSNSMHRRSLTAFQHTGSPAASGNLSWISAIQLRACLVPEIFCEMLLYFFLLLISNYCPIMT